MTLAQRIAITSDDGRGATITAMAALLLFSVIAMLVWVGLRPTPAAASAPRPPAAASPIANAEEQACAAALARARDTRGLPAEAAIAASTAMLRACDVR